jgi:hypothetical protein
VTLCHRGASSEERRHWGELLQCRVGCLPRRLYFSKAFKFGRPAAPSHGPVAFALESLPLDAITVNNPR